MKCVLLFSGGLDSTVALYILRARGWEVFPLAVDYGQPHSCELEAVLAIEPSAKVIRTEAMPMLGREGKSSIVPGRNLVLLALGVSYAKQIGATHVALAAQPGDHAVYPDCRPEFFTATAMLTHAAYEVMVMAPLVHMHRSVIVQRGVDLGVPFEKTWSCYEGQAIHCGVCGACKSRRGAFAAAACKDPTEYEA